MNTGFAVLFFVELFLSALFFIFRLMPFRVGDWVTWAYERNDPNGPFAHMIDVNKWKPDGKLNGDIINDRSIRYDPPPYEVVEVFLSNRPGVVKGPRGNRADIKYPSPLASVGHHQYVRVVMYRKPPYADHEKKIRTFSGKLFKKVPPPRSKKK